MSYIYKRPQLINSPKGKVDVVKILFDGETDSAYSLAIIKWEGVLKLGIRWNIAEGEWEDAKKQQGMAECIGNPQSRGHSTWFVLPDNPQFYDLINEGGKELKKIKDIESYR